MKKNKEKWNRLKKNKDLIVIALPAIISITLFAYLPMFGIFIAFKDINYSKGIWKSDWIGLKNFEFFFGSQDAWRITRNTLLYNLVFIIVGLGLAILLAIILYELQAKVVKCFQTILFFPYFLSWVIVGFVAYVFLNPNVGVLNQILEYFGGEAVNWYAESKVWPIILIFFNIWKNVGYNTIIFYTGLMSVDQTLYEAAAVDGANKLQQKIHITLPMLKPLIIIMVMLAIGKIMYADFGLFYFIPRDSGMIYSTTDVIDTYVYRALRVTGELGMSAAAAFYQSIIGCLVVIISNGIIKRVSPEDSIF